MSSLLSDNKAWWLFFIGFFVVFAGVQRNGHMAAFMLTGGLMLAPQINNHWVRAYYLYTLILGVFIYGALIANPSPRIGAMHLSSLDTLVKLSCAMVILIAFQELKRSEFERTANILCIFALLQAFLVYLQALGINPMVWMVEAQGAAIKPGIYLVSGTLGNPNFTGITLALIAPFFMRGKWKYILPAIIPALFLMKTTTAIIAFVCGMGYWGWKTYPKARTLVVAILFAMMTVFFLSFDFGDSGERFRYWKQLLRSVSSWWTLGGGIGSYRIWFHLEHPHNEYLLTFFEGGIVHILIVLGFLLGFAKRLWEASNKTQLIILSSMVVLAVSALGNYPLRLAPSGFIALALLGMYNGRLSDLR